MFINILGNLDGYTSGMCSMKPLLTYCEVLLTWITSMWLSEVCIFVVKTFQGILSYFTPTIILSSERSL